MTTKDHLYTMCEEYVESRIQRILRSLKDLEEDMESEGKNSAGDKYETGREMMSEEWNKLYHYLFSTEFLSNIRKFSGVPVTKTKTITFMLLTISLKVPLQWKER